MKVKDWVDQTTSTLKDAGVESARLDAELLACKNYGIWDYFSEEKPQSREDIIANPDRELSAERVEVISEYAARRALHEPMAYLMNFKEFYGRHFTVNKKVLIPRPETEVLIDIAKTLVGDQPKKILDVGTGSGCIAVTLKQELPQVQITASDVSSEAIYVAVLNNARGKRGEHITGNKYSFFLKKQRRAKNQNRVLTSYEMDFVRSDLLENIDGKFDLIVANLPYIDADDPNWEVSEELKFEPKKALYAATQGTALMRKLIRQAPKNLERNGHLLLEMDTRQLDKMSSYATKHGFKEVERHPFALLLQRTA